MTLRATTPDASDAKTIVVELFDHAIAYKVEEAAAGLKQQGAGGTAHVVDAAKADDVRALAAAVLGKHDRIDVAVTTPAIHVRKLMCDYTDEEYDRVADLNLRGTFYFLREFGRIMSRQRGGSLIASSSVRATTLEPVVVVPPPLLLLLPPHPATRRTANAAAATSDLFTPPSLF